MIYVQLKNNDTPIGINNDNNVTASEILKEIHNDYFIRLYNYIFSCNDIEYIEVKDE